MPILGKGQKTANWAQEANPWGTHDKLFFSPADDVVLRCPNCNRLMAHDFSSEGKCPNCNMVFTKVQWRDMFVEAMQVKAITGKQMLKARLEGDQQGVKQVGYNHDILDTLRLKDKPSTIALSGDARPVGDPARTMAAQFLALRKKQKKMLERIRSQSSVSQRLKWRPPS